MSDQVPVRKAAIYRAIDAIKKCSEIAKSEARNWALDSLVGPDELREDSRVRALNWYHRSVGGDEAVRVIEETLDEAVLSGEPLV